MSSIMYTILGHWRIWFQPRVFCLRAECMTGGRECPGDWYVPDIYPGEWFMILSGALEPDLLKRRFISEIWIMHQLYNRFDTHK